MKLSCKLEYSCRVLAQLARLYESGRLAHIEELAEIEVVPANYLVQILNELRSSGLVISKRGKQGGYALSRSPNRIGLCEIVAAIDNELLENKIESKGHSGESVARIWDAIGNKLKGAIESYTLEAFVVSESNTMYYI